MCADNPIVEPSVLGHDRVPSAHPTLQLMIAGAMTYVRKGIAPAQLAEVLHRAMQARPVYAPAAA